MITKCTVALMHTPQVLRTGSGLGAMKMIRTEAGRNRQKAEARCYKAECWMLEMAGKRQRRSLSHQAPLKNGMSRHRCITYNTDTYSISTEYSEQILLAHTPYRTLYTYNKQVEHLPGLTYTGPIKPFLVVPIIDAECSVTTGSLSERWPRSPCTTFYTSL